MTVRKTVTSLGMTSIPTEIRTQYYLNETRKCANHYVHRDVQFVLGKFSWSKRDISNCILQCHVCHFERGLKQRTDGMCVVDVIGRVAHCIDLHQFAMIP